jgi:hypothetical protein
VSSVSDGMTDLHDSSSRSLLSWSGLLALVAFSIFRLPPWLPLFAIESNGVDPSWQMLLNEAVPHGWTFGRDLFFTYGPFGFIHARMYHPETWAVVIAAWVGISMIMADLVWRIAGAGRLTPTWRTLCGIVMLELMSRDAMAVCFCLHAFVFLEAAQLKRNDAKTQRDVKSSRPFASLRRCVKSIVDLFQRTRLALPILLLAALPWAKFSYFVTAAFLGGSLVVVALLQRRISWRAALLFTACPLAWVITGGTLAECREFILAGFQLAGGYSAAMGLPPQTSAGWTVVISAGCVVLLLPVWMGVRLHPGDRRQCVLTMLFFWGLLFIAWKSCFVRYHEGRIPVFLGTVLPLLVYGFIVRVEPALAANSRSHWQSQWHTFIRGVGAASYRLSGPALLTSVLIVVSAGTVELVRPLSASRVLSALVTPAQEQLVAIAASAKDPDWRRQVHEAQLAAIRKANPVPEIDGTVDVFPSKLIVAFAHGLELQPRPVLQSYAAFTPALIDRDARHFRGPNAPDNVLISVRAIDGRLPMLEDSQAWLELLSRYELTDSSDAFLRLGRQPQSRLLLDDEPVLRKTVRWNEDIEVPADLAGPVWCRIQIKPSLPGRLASILYRLPEIHLKTSVGYDRNDDRTFRLLPGAAGSGFLIIPLVESREDLVRLWQWADQSEPHHAGREDGFRFDRRSFAIAVEDGSELLFKPDISVEFFQLTRSGDHSDDSVPSNEKATLGQRPL